MQQTEKYQFNLIESSDTFSAEPLNENMEKVETVFSGRSRVLCCPYVGTGTTSRTFTFDEQPQAIILFAPTYGYGFAVLGRNTTEFYPVPFIRTSNYHGKASWPENSVHLYPYDSHTTDPAAIFNTKDVKYLLIAMLGGVRTDFMPTE